MHGSSSDNPNPFHHHTLKFRAVFVPDGADISMADITRAVGPNPVMIPAVLVPDGGTLPGYPYEHIGRAQFIPDQDQRASATRTSPRLAAPSRTGAQQDALVPGNRALSGLRQFGAALANEPGPWAPDVGPARIDPASGVSAPRRGVRSTQANFSAAAPQPHLDASPDAIDAAVRALNARPATWDYSGAASWAASAIPPGTAPPPLQFPIDLTSAATTEPVARNDARPSQLVTDAAQERQPGTVAAFLGSSADDRRRLCIPVFEQRIARQAIWP